MNNKQILRFNDLVYLIYTSSGNADELTAEKNELEQMLIQHGNQVGVIVERITNSPIDVTRNSRTGRVAISGRHSS